MRRRYVASGELLAMGPGAVQRGAEGFFWMLGGESPPNSRHPQYADVAIVKVRGALEHHLTFGADSYEALVARVEAAASGADVCEEGADPVPPSAIILDIDSRGGVVAGMGEAVAKLRQIGRQVPIVAVLNEMAASAAFAVACGASKRYAPASAICGSIGTISTMVSVAEQDAENGIDVRLITSGARKADGHPHAPISDAAVNAERARVETMAAAFYRLAATALGVTAATVEGWQAGIFLGPEAKRRRLIDDVRNVDEVAALYSKGDAKEANALDRTAHAEPSSLAHGAHMKLTSKIALLSAALAGETDPTKRAAQSKLVARKYEALAVAAEKGDDDPDDDEDDEDEDSKSAKAAEKAEKSKKAAKAAGHKARADEFKKKAAEAEDEAKRCLAEDEGEGEESSAALALVEKATGLKGQAALGAAAALFGDVVRQGEALKTIQRESADAKRSALLASVEKCTTSAEKAMLASFGVEQLKAFVDVRLKSGLVHTDDSTLVRPKAATPGTEDALSADVLAMIDVATEHYNGDKKTFRASQVAAHLEAHKKQLAGANGAPGRI